ncbi:hypothetical protein HispidOSU_012451, partial [Sigmodon hispidus]
SKTPQDNYDNKILTIQLSIGERTLYGRATYPWYGLGTSNTYVSHMSQSQM